MEAVPAMRRKLIVVGIALAAVALGGILFYDSVPGTVRRVKQSDGDQKFRGTGRYTWSYPDGAPLRVDKVRRGAVVTSTWYARNGDVLGRTEWSNGDGIALILRPDGTIRARATCRQDLWHGTVWYYAPDGELAGEAEFAEGDFVSGFHPPKGF
jgi:hypothetical protein